MYTTCIGVRRTCVRILQVTVTWPIVYGWLMLLVLALANAIYVQASSLSAYTDCITVE
jgi:hypothetical protein